MSIFLKAFLFVLLAEMGDKTQLLSVAFASKYKVKEVLIGITSAIILLNRSEERRVGKEFYLETTLAVLYQ